MSRPRVVMRGPEHVDADAYIAQMRASRRFHRPWIVAPTDREAWDKLLARHATPQVEVLFALRRSRSWNGPDSGARASRRAT